MNVEQELEAENFATYTESNDPADYKCFGFTDECKHWYCPVKKQCEEAF